MSINQKRTLAYALSGLGLLMLMLSGYLQGRAEVAKTTPVAVFVVALAIVPISIGTRLRRTFEISDGRKKKTVALLLVPGVLMVVAASYLMGRGATLKGFPFVSIILLVLGVCSICGGFMLRGRFISDDLPR